MSRGIDSTAGERKGARCQETPIPMVSRQLLKHFLKKLAHVFTATALAKLLLENISFKCVI